MYKKRIDECLFCKSRKTTSRVYRESNPHYDEVSCDKHYKDLMDHSDKMLGKNNGLMRWYINGTSQKKRGEKVDYKL